ncbi:MAG: electron transfer flavoprotein subunit beta/FixA family protein [Atopobiaceae bacterium]|nr:electron transfer flavoprotein subunit beta/FixA family protein [Atopobiaceae bacterium]
MNIAVCIKSVPDPAYYEQITIDPESKRLVRDGIPAVINDADKHAHEAALQLKEACGGEISVVSMGPPAARAQLMEALAAEADRAFLVSDRKLGGADSLATSYTLAKLIETTGNYGLVLCANESADGATAHVPSQLGVWLGATHATGIVDVSWDNGVVVSKQVEGGRGRYRLNTPCVVGVTAQANEVRFCDVRTILAAKNKPLEILSADDLNDLDETFIGLAGSPSQNGKVEALTGDKECVILTGDDAAIAEQVVSIIRSINTGAEEA